MVNVLVNTSQSRLQTGLLDSKVEFIMYVLNVQFNLNA